MRVALVVVVVLFAAGFWMLSPGGPLHLETAIINVAKADVRLRLRDLNVTFSDVNLRYVDPLNKSRAYVCGTALASYDSPAKSRRFLYTDDAKELAMGGDNERLDDAISGICGAR